jgi:hypothetical protein
MASASSAGGTKVLFVPYRPSSASSSSTAPSFRQTRIPLSEEDDAHISQQKHAAREYHRKAKLQRYGDLGPSKKKPPRRRSTKVESSWEDGKGRSPPKQDALSLGRGHDGLPDGTKARGVEYHSFVPRAELGAGQLDPFSAVVPKDLSPYHSEMLEHGTSTGRKLLRCFLVAQSSCSGTCPISGSLLLLSAVCCSFVSRREAIAQRAVLLDMLWIPFLSDD